MSENDDRMSDSDLKTEQWIRRTMASVRPPEDYRRTLRLVLRAEMLRTRHRFVSPAAILAFFVFMAIAVNQIDVGSGDFGMKPAGESWNGELAFTSKIGNDAAIGLNQSIHETIAEHHSAKEAKLKSVFGWVIAGQLYLSATYFYTINGEYHELGRPPDTPATRPSQQHIKFFREFLQEWHHLRNTGNLAYTGFEDCMVDGYPVRFDKWTVSIKDFGPVTYWEGYPLVAL